VIVDDYTCLTFKRASKELLVLGLVPVLLGTAPVLPQCPNRNFVAEQTPTAGETVSVGSVVAIPALAESRYQVGPSFVDWRTHRRMPSKRTNDGLFVWATLNAGQLVGAFGERCR
jgi:hypothetical protein